MCTAQSKRQKGGKTIYLILVDSKKLGSKMGRFLMNLAYTGLNYKGLQHQRRKGLRTILETVEKAMEPLNPANEKISIVSSSRTDKGVNALSNAIHVDLEHKEEGKEYEPREISCVVNQNLIYEGEDIRVLRTLRVPDDFHCRKHALSRTYIYRLALNKNLQPDLSTPFNHFEYLRTYAVYKKQTDLELVRQVAEMLSGTHNFSGFSTRKAFVEQPWLNPIKTLQVSVTEGQSFMGCHFPDYHNQMFDYVDLVFKGNSFLYRQVRRMTAIMLAVGQGMLNIDVVHQLLTDPKKVGIDHLPVVYMVPAFALYLKEVEYNPEDLIYKPEETKTNNLVNEITEEPRNNPQNCHIKTEESNTKNIVEDSSLHENYCEGTPR